MRKRGQCERGGSREDSWMETNDGKNTEEIRSSCSVYWCFCIVFTPNGQNDDYHNQFPDKLQRTKYTVTFSSLNLLEKSALIRNDKVLSFCLNLIEKLKLFL